MATEERRGMRVKTRCKRGHCAGLLTVLGALSGCGARTGLRVPCEYAVEPTTPRVAIVLEHTSGWFRYGPSPARVLLAQVLPQLDPVAEVSLFVTHHVVEAGTAPQRPDCEAPTAPFVTPRLHASNAILETLTPWDYVGQFPPVIFVPTYDELGIAQQALEAEPHDVLRIVMLMTNGEPGCLPAVPAEQCFCGPIPVENCLQPPRGGIGLVPNSCIDLPRVSGRLHEMNAEGIETIVVAAFDTREFLPDLPVYLNGLAEAGGLPRQSSGRQYYRLTEPEELAAGLARDVVAQRACWLRAPGPIEHRDALVLIDSAGREVPRDPSQRDGWDWLETAHGTLRIYGTACERVVAQPPALHFITRGSLCEM